MTAWRTEFSAFILDPLDFVEEKIKEALENERSRRAAIGEAAGAIPVLRERARENDLVQTHLILGLHNFYEERWAAEEWEDFAVMDRDKFERTARELLDPDGGPFANLRKVLREAGAP